MPGLRDLVRAVQQDLPITVRMENWLVNNPDPQYSSDALKFSDDVLRGKVGGKRNRTLAFRASGMGKCMRKRVFARIGSVAQSEQFSSTQANNFATGNAMHRKWQMAGITEGWLIQAEVPLYNSGLDLGGTADGYIYDGSLFEYKTINSRGYKWVTAKGIEESHQRQVAAYKLLNPRLTAASVVYENKETAEWREFRMEFTPEVIDPMYRELVELQESLQEHVLPPIKEQCLTRSGMEYRTCPFRDTCLKTKVWPRNHEG